MTRAKPITVRELVNYLQTLDQDKVILRSAYEFGYEDFVTSVSETTVRMKDNDKHWGGDYDDDWPADTPGAMSVYVL